ncbi:MAG: glutathione S-transferase family protein [SAR324 cluster bacterium]|nr:glutathione S-transferase family protein [SAR324 cluster bacterium]MBL7034725.1 glutathione S-transferase family protein [SAR324 cluster bacterium]
MIKLYDLAGADENRRFSPYCWRAKMALAHKGLEAVCLPWHFTQKEIISFSGQERVPVLVDGDNTVSDSWEIAKYLEKEYPDTPSLKLEAGEVLFTKYWVETILHPDMLQLLIMDIYNNLVPEDQRYFRESREKLFGKTLEEVAQNREERLPRFQKLLTPLRITLKKQDFVAGETPGFSDYIVFGAFQWARCISAFPLLKTDDSIYAWREKMLALHDGLAQNAVGFPV